MLVGMFDVAESKFWFDPQSGRLVALEMFPDADVDPCEIDFLDYRAVGQRSLPHRLVVRYGDSIFTEIRLREVTVP